MDSNSVYNQYSWGIVVHDYPDTETPPSSGLSHCQGGVQATQALCLFRSQGSVISNNTLHHNGGFGNPTNGDLALEASAATPRDCFFGNLDPTRSGSVPSSDPPNIQDSTVDGPPCDSAVPGTGDSTLLAAELVCASGAYAACPSSPGHPGYPTSSSISVLPLSPQTTMPNPCEGVPDNPWCSGGLLVSQPGSAVPEGPLAWFIPLAGTAAILLAVGLQLRRGRRLGGPARGR